MVPIQSAPLGMDPSIVGTGGRIVRFKRSVKRKAAIRDIADIEAIFGRQAAGAGRR